MHSDKEKGCGCGGHGQDKGEGCGGHGHDHGESCGCGNNDDHDHGDGCGCGHDHHHQSVTLTLHDGTELECPLLDVFDINEQKYIALLNPEDETALLYRFFEGDDDSISIENIDSDEEFELVTKTFMALQEDEEDEEE